MRMITIPFVVLSLLLAPNITSAAQPTIPHKAALRFAPDRLIVRLKNQADRSSLERITKKYSGVFHKQIGKRQTFVIKVKSSQRDTLHKILKQDRRLASVQLDRMWQPSFIPNDPLYTKQWHLNKINAPSAWDTSRGTGIKLAILDSGVDASHPELQTRTENGWNTYDNSSNTTDQFGHGTWVAGTAAAAMDNSVGVSGTSNATILPIKITDPDGYGYSSTIADGLAWASSHGAKIANISYSIYAGDEIITEAARDFTLAGGLVFAAAGNDGTHYSYADNPYIISVGSIDQSGAQSSFSTTGPFVDLFAPGDSIITSSPNNQYAEVTGTSFASPIAAGIAALVWSAHPTLNSLDVESVLEQTASAGQQINAEAAVGTNTPTPAPNPEPVPVPLPKPAPTPTSTPKMPDEPIITTSTPQFIFPIANSSLKHDKYVLLLNIPDGLPVQRVEYFDNDKLIGVALQQPFSFEWNARSPSHTPEGAHTISARIVTLAKVIELKTSLTILDEQANNRKDDFPASQPNANKKPSVELEKKALPQIQIPAVPQWKPENKSHGNNSKAKK